MPKEIKPKKATLNAADRRQLRELFQAELKPIRDELRKLRRELDNGKNAFGKMDQNISELNRMVNG